MTDTRLDEADLTDFLRFAALTSTLTTPTPTVEVRTSPRTTPARALVIQGDVAFLPVSGVSGDVVPGRLLSGRVAILGDPVGHRHWLIPNGPGVALIPGRTPTVEIPDGSSALIHHDADPIEHADLMLGPGLWSIRVQRLPAPVSAVPAVRAERYWWPTWLIPGDGGIDFGGQRYWSSGC